MEGIPLCTLVIDVALYYNVLVVSLNPRTMGNNAQVSTILCYKSQ